MDPSEIATFESLRGTESLPFMEFGLWTVTRAVAARVTAVAAWVEPRVYRSSGAVDGMAIRLGGSARAAQTNRHSSALAPHTPPSGGVCGARALGLTCALSSPDLLNILRRPSIVLITVCMKYG